jgi:DNA-binding transcriptional ArsR family regulator
MAAVARSVLSEPDLDSTFAALADATRRAIVARLAVGEASVLELAAPFDMSQPAISKHLKVLERAGLITRSRDAQRRPCRLAPQRLEQLSAWVEGYRKVWEDSYARLDDLLHELKTTKNKGKEKPRDAKTRNHRTSRRAHDHGKARVQRAARARVRGVDQS